MKSLTEIIFAVEEIRGHIENYKRGTTKEFRQCALDLALVKVSVLKLKIHEYENWITGRLQKESEQ